MKYAKEYGQLLNEASNRDEDLDKYMLTNGTYVWEYLPKRLRYTWNPSTKYVRAYVDNTMMSKSYGGDTRGQLIGEDITNYAEAEALVDKRFTRDLKIGRKNLYVTTSRNTRSYAGPNHNIKSGDDSDRSDAAKREMFESMAQRPNVGETSERGEAIVWAMQYIKKLESKLSGE